jgi:hypothetical protein
MEAESQSKRLMRIVERQLFELEHKVKTLSYLFIELKEKLEKEKLEKEIKKD